LIGRQVDPEGRPTRRPFSFGAWAHAAIALASLPLLLAFTWQSGIASMSDDSVSYLAIARWMSRAGSISDSWAYNGSSSSASTRAGSWVTPLRVPRNAIE